MRESQVGRALKMFWFAFGFMTTTFVGPREAGGCASEGKAFLNKGVRFFGKDWIENPSTQLPRGLMVTV